MTRPAAPRKPARPRKPLPPSPMAEPLPVPRLPAIRGWMLRVNETLRTRVNGMLGGAAHELSQLKVADVRMLVQELDTHQVELEQQNEELRMAQLALLESRDRLSDLYEFAPVGYLTLDAGGVIRQSNLAAAQLLGQSRQKLLGRRLAAFVASADAPAFDEHLGLALVSERKTQCELGVYRADRGVGSALRLRLESNRIRAAGVGGAAGASCQMALIDITQATLDRGRLADINRDLEAAVAARTADLSASLTRLRDNEERLSLALDAGLMGSWTLDLAAREVRQDRRHERQERLYGRAPGSASEPLDGWIALLHPDDRERMVTVIARVISGQDLVLSAEYRVLWPDGSAHWLAVRGRAIRDARGKPLQVVGVEQDIDERKSLEMEVLHIADREQRHIGQELHDDIQQRLTGLGLMAESLCDTLGTQAPPEQALCARLTQGIGETAERVNRLSHGLVPLELEGDGLVLALHRLALNNDVPGRLACVFKYDKGLEIHDGFAASHLYRIAQEALTNALRHSGASRVTMWLKRAPLGAAPLGAAPLGAAPLGAALCIADNGVGIKPKKDDGRGLRIMAYRASLIGATLKIENAKTTGTLVTCVFPLARVMGAQEKSR